MKLDTIDPSVFCSKQARDYAIYMHTDTDGGYITTVSAHSENDAWDEFECSHARRLSGDPFRDKVEIRLVK